MNRIVLPLSNFAVPAGGMSLGFADLASHMFLFGLPIALAAHRWPGSPHKTDNTGSIDMLGKFRPRHYQLSTTLLGSAACISPAYAQDLPGGEKIGRAHV